MTMIRPYPETNWYPAEKAVITFDKSGRPDRVLLISEGRTVRDLPADRITRLEGDRDDDGSFTLHAQLPSDPVRHHVTAVEMRSNAVLAWRGSTMVWDYFVDREKN